jgi:photosystem I P700 chlorophyll a apoprotein A2
LDYNSSIFTSHLSHSAVVLLWLAASGFHIAWNGNFTIWTTNPLSVIGSSHASIDPHFSFFGSGNSFISPLGLNTPSYCGIYNWLYTVGITKNYEIYLLVIFLEVAALLVLLGGGLVLTSLEKSLGTTGYSGSGTALDSASLLMTLYSYPINLRSASTSSSSVISFLGYASILWSGHLIHVSGPVSRGFDYLLGFSAFINHLLSGSWVNFALEANRYETVFGASDPLRSYSSSATYGVALSFSGSLRSDTFSLFLGDISHHHLALGVLLLWSLNVFRMIYKSVGYRFLSASYFGGENCNKGSSSHLNLSISLGLLGILVSLVSQHIYALNPYVYMTLDIVTTLLVYVHHQYIGSILMVGSLSHLGIFISRDFVHHRSSLVSRLLLHKHSIISHLSWVTLILGFHTLGLYIHNDSVVAFSSADKQILIEPIFGQIVLESTSDAVSTLQSSIPLTSADLLAHHALGLGLHLCVLIMVKSSFDASGSGLIPDKVNLGFSFPCDGPGRGGTCDSSGYDGLYLTIFWLLNTISWASFYIHWRHITLNYNNLFQYVEGGSYLNGWFRDYLWYNSGTLINGYNAVGVNDISAFNWTFLFAHLVWATGFKFLISWRGYWQELVETIVLVHNKTPFVYSIWNSCSVLPMALSILEARFVGLVHFSVGLVFTYGAFAVGSL